MQKRSDPERRRVGNDDDDDENEMDVEEREYGSEGYDKHSISSPKRVDKAQFASSDREARDEGGRNGAANNHSKEAGNGEDDDENEQEDPSAVDADSSMHAEVTRLAPRPLKQPGSLKRGRDTVSSSNSTKKRFTNASSGGYGKQKKDQYEDFEEAELDFNNQMSSSVAGDYDDEEDDDSGQKEKKDEKGDIKLHQRIFGNWKNSGNWYPGEVTHIYNDKLGFFDILFDDGDIERKVPRHRLKKDNSVLKIGQKIKCDWFERGIYYKGRISKVHNDETYDVAYDDGDKEENVPRKRIKFIKLNVGEKVVANYLGENIWYRGKIEQVHGNLYDIAYADGDREKNVLPENVRKDTISLYTSEKVWANWKAYGPYYKARVVKIDGERYSLLYEDGDFETNVPRKRIKPEAYFSLQIGQKVLGSFQESKEFYPGSIAGIRLIGDTDPTEKEYEILYDDGDTERRVPIDRIIPLEDGGLLGVGQEILANWKSLGHYYHGKVTKVCPNDLYDITYDDGEIEEKVHRYQIETL